MTYNPYDLLKLRIDGCPIDGRPIEFDGTPHVSDWLVKPILVSTVCPACGQGLEFQISLDDPPFEVIDLSCKYCHPKPVETPDPFMNPLKSGRIASHELDPLLHNPDEQMVLDDGKTVAERISEKSPEPSSAGLEDEMSSDTQKLSQISGKPKETPEEPQEQEFMAQRVDGPIAPLQLAEDMGTEENFDDDDLVESG